MCFAWGAWGGGAAGDVLYFPANWAHHTEALADEGAEPSFSLGFRTDGAYLL